MATYDKYSNKLSDATRLFRSKPIDVSGNHTYNAIRVPRHHFVEDVWLHKKVVLSGGTPALTVGFSGNGESADVDYFMDSTSADPTTAGIARAAEANHEGKYFTGGVGIITVTISGTPTAGLVEVFAKITRIS